MEYLDHCCGLLEVTHGKKNLARAACAIAVLFALIATLLAGAAEWDSAVLDAAAVILAIVAVGLFYLARRAPKSRRARGLIGIPREARVGAFSLIPDAASVRCTLPAEAATGGGFSPLSVATVDMVCLVPAADSFCITSIEITGSGLAGERRPVMKVESHVQCGRPGIFETSMGLHYMLDGKLHALSGGLATLFEVVPDVQQILKQLFPHADISGRITVLVSRSSLGQVGRNTALFGMVGAAATLAGDASRVAAARRLVEGDMVSAEGRTFTELLHEHGWTLDAQVPGASAL